MENMDTDVWLETVNKSGSRSQAFPSPPVYKKGACAAKGDGTKASKIRKKGDERKGRIERKLFSSS